MPSHSHCQLARSRTSNILYVYTCTSEGKLEAGEGRCSAADGVPTTRPVHGRGKILPRHPARPARAPAVLCVAQAAAITHHSSSDSNKSSMSGSPESSVHWWWAIAAAAFAAFELWWAVCSAGAEGLRAGDSSSCSALLSSSTASDVSPSPPRALSDGDTARVRGVACADSVSSENSSCTPPAPAQALPGREAAREPPNVGREPPNLDAATGGSRPFGGGGRRRDRDCRRDCGRRAAVMGGGEVVDAWGRGGRLRAVLIQAVGIALEDGGSKLPLDLRSRGVGRGVRGARCAVRGSGWREPTSFSNSAVSARASAFFALFSCSAGDVFARAHSAAQ